MLYDRNPTHRLVLEDTQYRPMIDADATAELAPCDYAYLKQRQYVARTRPAGLAVATEPFFDGWERLAESAWMEKLGRR